MGATAAEGHSSPAADVVVWRRGGSGAPLRSLPVRCGVAPDHHPAAEIMPDRCTPAYERILAKMGALLPYRRARSLLDEFFPLGDAPEVETNRQRTMRVGARLERDTAALPRSTPTEAGSTALAIDGGHVKSAPSYQVCSFEVFVAQDRRREFRGGVVDPEGPVAEARAFRIEMGKGRHHIVRARSRKAFFKGDQRDGADFVAHTRIGKFFERGQRIPHGGIRREAFEQSDGRVAGGDDLPSLRPVDTTLGQSQPRGARTAARSTTSPAAMRLSGCGRRTPDWARDPGVGELWVGIENSAEPYRRRLRVGAGSRSA